MSHPPPTSHAVDAELRRQLLLTAQVALLGELSAAVRAVTLGWDHETIKLRAVLDGPVSEDDQESIECVGTEIVASFPKHAVQVETIRLDAPADFRASGLAAWVHIRKER